ncbi:hypothetical protein GE061_012575, partial [Apolygus lucorum]
MRMEAILNFLLLFTLLTSVKSEIHKHRTDPAKYHRLVALLKEALTHAGVNPDGIKVTSILKKREIHRINYKMKFVNQLGKPCNFEWYVDDIFGLQTPKIPICGKVATGARDFVQVYEPLTVPVPQFRSMYPISGPLLNVVPGITYGPPEINPYLPLGYQCQNGYQCPHDSETVIEDAEHKEESRNETVKHHKREHLRNPRADKDRDKGSSASWMRSRFLYSSSRVNIDVITRSERHCNR